MYKLCDNLSTIVLTPFILKFKDKSIWFVVFLFIYTKRVMIKELKFSGEWNSQTTFHDKVGN